MNFTLSPAMRRSLYLTLAFLIAGVIISRFHDSSPDVVAPAETPARAEARLEQLKAAASTVPAKEEILKKTEADLAAREKGLIAADTAPQAQAQLISIVREIGRAESPAVEIRNTDGFGIRAFGDSYGEAYVSLTIECRIDQLINMLAAIAARPELISTNDLRVNSSAAKDKVVGVHLTIAGIVPRKLVPEKHS